MQEILRKLPPEQRSEIELISSGRPSELNRFLSSLTESEALNIAYDWRLNARPKQRLPGTAGSPIQRQDWLYWVILAGRGFGKTKTGAETVRSWASNPAERILVIGPTTNDVGEVCIDGPSGIMSCFPPGQKPTYNAHKKRITFPSGAVGIVRSADEPERLRGPQFTKFWFDEFAACRYAKEAWEQLSFGFRMKTKRLQGLVTTTPKPIKPLKDLLVNPKTVITRGSSYENQGNISQEFYEAVIRPYEGTRLGRQEIDAELLEDVPGALWTRQLIEATRIERMSEVQWDKVVRVVIAVDPAVSSGENADETGIIVACLTISGHVLILADLSLNDTPVNWGTVVAAAYKSFRADKVYGEVNNGGDLVERNIRAILPNVNYGKIHAKRGKFLRAEPVASLFGRGLVHHVGSFPVLEDQMCEWTPLSDEKSPDRLDALVYAVTALIFPEEDQMTNTQIVNRYTI